MSRIFDWIKSHKIIVLLLLIIGYLLYTRSHLGYPMPLLGRMEDPSIAMKYAPDNSGVMPSTDIGFMQEAPPTTGIENRMVVTDSYLSLLVNNVQETQKRIIDTAKQLGGYMVESNLTNPEDNATSTLTVRIPSSKFDEALQLFRSYSVKVITESLSGQDVTDQYVDNKARLDTLNKTKIKFEEILDNATKVQDILEVQRELINLQSQIDAILGQQQYLEKNAEMAKITAYLSTDELALPYAPSDSWRPGVIFKEAVRSLIMNVRKVADLIIWLAVYAVVWVPILLVILFFKKRLRS